jgi:hypothetical protein
VKVRHEADGVMTGRRGEEVKWLEDQPEWSCCGETGVKRMKQDASNWMRMNERLAGGCS